jgi:uncharacterized protein (DUF1778 family)
MTVLSVRVSESERDLLTAAAEHAHTNLSDFVRRRALEAAEMDMLERRVVTIPADDWEAFESWVNSPAKPNPALRKALTALPPWED